MQTLSIVAVIFVASISANLAGCTPSAPAPAPSSAVDMVGTWKNERGSELKIDVVTAGQLTGHYRSAVGKVDGATWFPTVGFVQGDVVGFTVDFTSAGSVASWAGQLEGNQLKTQWHLSRDVPDAEEHEKLWSSILSGSDTFTRE
ncbi:MAG TPA: avidin/streptavidin family protein [Myxococcota bacterium]